MSSSGFGFSALLSELLLMFREAVDDAVTTWLEVLAPGLGLPYTRPLRELGDELDETISLSLSNSVILTFK